jgi:cardiolipin synthase
VIINLPNGLTVLRLILTPVVVLLLLREDFSWAFFVFLIAGITDGLDGFLARSLREGTEFGRMLDPVADKLLLGASLFTLGVVERVPFWLPVIAIGRDLILMVGSCILYVTSGRLGYPPSVIGKLTTGLQVLTVLAAMTVTEGGAPVDSLVWAVATLTVLSGLDYTYRGIVDVISRLRNASPA